MPRSLCTSRDQVTALFVIPYTYDEPVDDALRLIWESLNDVCEERLARALVPIAGLLDRHGDVWLEAALTTQ